MATLNGSTWPLTIGKVHGTLQTTDVFEHQSRLGLSSGSSLGEEARVPDEINWTPEAVQKHARLLGGRTPTGLLLRADLPPSSENHRPLHWASSSTSSTSGSGFQFGRLGKTRCSKFQPFGFHQICSNTALESQLGGNNTAVVSLV